MIESLDSIWYYPNRLFKKISINFVVNLLSTKIMDIIKENVEPGGLFKHFWMRW